MQALSWQLWKLWGNVGGKMLPWGTPGPGLSTSPPPHSTVPAGPVWRGSCNLTWFPSFPWETTGCGSCQLSRRCSRPPPGRRSLLLSWAQPQSSESPLEARRLLPPPLEPMRRQQQAPRTQREVSEPYLVILTRWPGSILETGNINHQNGWVLLPPGGRVRCIEHNSPLQWGTALYPARVDL